MSTIEAIEQAIERLTPTEREALESRLLTRRFGLDALNDQERTKLLASLNEAERDIDEGRVHTADELRHAVRSWTGE
jgi:predicted transcriptional regulator